MHAHRFSPDTLVFVVDRQTITTQNKTRQRQNKTHGVSLTMSDTNSPLSVPSPSVCCVRPPASLPLPTFLPSLPPPGERKHEHEHVHSCACLDHVMPLHCCRSTPAAVSPPLFLLLLLLIIVILTTRRPPSPSLPPSHRPVGCTHSPPLVGEI